MVNGKNRWLGDGGSKTESRRRNLSEAERTSSNASDMRLQPVLHAQNFLLMAKAMIVWYSFSEIARCTFGDILTA